MTVRIGLTPGDWCDALARFPAESCDVYFTPAFQAAHGAAQGCEPCCSLVEEGDHALLIVGLQVPIDSSSGEAEWDLQTCSNGYGGALATPQADRGFLERAWAAWAVELGRRGAVAAFFRMHPLMSDLEWLPPTAIVRRDRETVFVDLSDGRLDAWERSTGRHRNMVRKAWRQQVVVEWNTTGAWAAFESLYQQAMQSIGAPERFRFSSQYFETLRRVPDAEVALASDARGPMGGAVFLNGPRWCHYHLAARRRDSGNAGANIVIQAAIDRAADRRLVGVHLGGGRSTSADDALLRFKMSLGGRLTPYHVALVAIQPDRLATRNRAWADRNGRPPEWLLGYRQPAPTSEARVT
jgi:hypothetical protein